METIVYEKDILFLSKILGAASIKGTHIRVIKEPARCKELNDPKKMIVNLELNTAEILDALQDIMERFPATSIVGYCSHTNTKTMLEAKEMGIKAMPRSVFANKITDIL